MKNLFFREGDTIGFMIGDLLLKQVGEIFKIKLPWVVKLLGLNLGTLKNGDNCRNLPILILFDQSLEGNDFRLQ